jgi:hypothetical protein
MLERSTKLALLSQGVSLVLVLSLMPVISSAQSQQGDYIFPVNSSPYGVSFKDWTEKWWQWFLSIPKQHNPNMENALGDKYQAVDCSYLQDPSSPVFFVPYVMKESGQPAEATCNTSEGKAVMVGIDNGWMDTGDPRTKGADAQKLASYVKETNIYPNKFDITLDGKPVPLTNEEKYRVLSDPFNVTFPEDTFWEPPGTYQAVADGWYLMLKPLSPGEHILHYTTGYRDHRSDPTIPIGQGNKEPYIQDVTYRLLVKPSTG